MTKKIHKITIRVVDEVQSFKLPHTYKIRHVDRDTRRPNGDEIGIWYEFEPTDCFIAVNFGVYGTGHDIPDVSDYIGSVLGEHSFIWHIYEV